MSAISRNSCKESHFSKFHSWIFALIVVAVIFFYATSCPAVQITLAWDAYPPSEQVTTYSIYYKTNSPGPPYDGNEASEGPSPIIVPVAELTDPENPQYTVTNLSERERYFFAITATNDYGESAYSNEVSHSPLYFPHVDTNPPWETEIAIINNGSSDLTGTLLAYGNDGQLVESIPVNLAVRGRRQIDVADEFSNPDAIGYFILVTNSTAVRGYTKFYIEGQYRVAVPAVQEVNSGDVYLSHIASDAQWWTGVSILNTTASAKTLAFQFNDGQSRTVDLAAGEHKAFTIASLFGGVAQPTIGSAVITNGAGTVGLELFGSTGAGGESYLSGILLKGDTTSSIYYPHVASDGWWTGIVAYNPVESDTSITITPYSAAGVQLDGTQQVVPALGKYIGVVSALGLPAETAWLEITAASPISGFELFGTNNGSQLASYIGVGISTYGGVFAKLEDDGWTGIAFVNIEDSTATVTLTAYADSGAVVATEVMTVAANAKMVDTPSNIFSEDVSTATYIAFSSDREVVGFQLNGSSGGMMLDGLPGM